MSLLWRAMASFRDMVGYLLLTFTPHPAYVGDHDGIHESDSLGGWGRRE